MTLLKTSNITHFFGGLCAVSDFSIEIAPHELVGIIGPNGAGKTTVFNIITGVYRAASGSILFDGREITGKAAHRITGTGIARTFQNIRLFDELSVLDNIRVAHYGKVKYTPFEAIFHLGRHKREEQRIIDRSMELLSHFKMDNLALELSRNLPYGLKRRLEIVRALATEPKLLLLDEPAAGMNPREVDELMDFIRWIREEFHLAVLLIEHQMRLVMNLCQRLLVLDFGVTIAQGAPDEIRQNPLVLEAYLGETKTL
jgi:branched-chain amino acid transport system ATP-binding protein